MHKSMTKMEYEHLSIQEHYTTLANFVEEVVRPCKYCGSLFAYYTSNLSQCEKCVSIEMSNRFFGKKGVGGFIEELSINICPECLSFENIKIESKFSVYGRFQCKRCNEKFYIHSINNIMGKMKI